MRRKVVQDYANKVCQIFVGWRLAVHDRDIPRLIEVGDGHLRIDLLTGATLVDGRPELPPLGIAEELAAWLRDRCDRDRVDIGEVREAVLTVRFVAQERTTRRGTFVRHLQFDCHSRIDTGDRPYESALTTDEAWSRSSAEGAWFVGRDAAT